MVVTSEALEIWMSSNQLCMIFKDKATADLNNWLFVNLPLYCIIATVVIVYLIKT